MRRLLAISLMACALWFAGYGCAAKEPVSEPEVPVAEIVTPGEEAAAVGSETDSATDSDSAGGPPCHGVLSCTFFGLGAAIALPFWVLGAVLGLAF